MNKNFAKWNCNYSHLKVRVCLYVNDLALVSMNLKKKNKDEIKWEKTALHLFVFNIKVELAIEISLFDVDESAWAEVLLTQIYQFLLVIQFFISPLHFDLFLVKKKLTDWADKRLDWNMKLAQKMTEQHGR